MPREDDETELHHSVGVTGGLKKQLEAAVAANETLMKENQELKQEVGRLKAQISSLKAHDNERKSLLWKKLHSNPDDRNTGSSGFVDSENGYPKPSFHELAMRKDRQLEAPKPPPPPSRSHQKEVNENKAKTPALAPAPPPLPTKLLAGSRSVRRVPEVGELYRSLTRKDANMENKSNMTTTPLLAFTRNMIGEIENRSTYVSAIKSDVEKQKEFINFLISKVQSATFKDITDVEGFVKWLDGELSSLVDERAVLKHFPQWPERKADAMREAAFSCRDLKNLEAEVTSFKVNPKESFNSELKKMQALQDRLEQSVNNIERVRESSGKRYRELQIPWEWMLDTGFIGQMKFSSLKLAQEYMKRTAKELQSNECSQVNNLLLQGVRFAYRVHQFAGGFDADTIRAFEDLKKTSNISNPKQ
ncbi:hypothetical protein ES319_D03G163300v1 [Gossypium barbadense]|uniref:Protein CHUP1, chloroplastic n=2 Tax=Gossypium TaxID=3633 RepID=A0A5J5S535_GOSBA|nr:hypothetical protein ES319_D03G163300v1 [Gossypium barbadense]TYG77195.1 hypothetical protein ES288_D03G174900v1 [Gossypium darwinii]